jgi:hypothetical protein
VLQSALVVAVALSVEGQETTTVAQLLMTPALSSTALFAVNTWRF